MTQGDGEGTRGRGRFPSCRSLPRHGKAKGARGRAIRDTARSFTFTSWVADAVIAKRTRAETGHFLTGVQCEFVVTSCFHGGLPTVVFAHVPWHVFAHVPWHVLAVTLFWARVRGRQSHVPCGSRMNQAPVWGL